MNERQSAYRSAEGIISLLSEYGKDCPACVAFTYAQGFYSPGYILVCANPFDSQARDEILVCPRCRGFGRVLHLTQDKFLNYSHYITVLREIAQSTDCPI